MSVPREFGADSLLAEFDRCTIRQADDVDPAVQRSVKYVIEGVLAIRADVGPDDGAGNRAAWPRCRPSAFSLVLGARFGRKRKLHGRLRRSSAVSRTMHSARKYVLSHTAAQFMRASQPSR